MWYAGAAKILGVGWVERIAEDATNRRERRVFLFVLRVTAARHDPPLPRPGGELLTTCPALREPSLFEDAYLLCRDFKFERKEFTNCRNLPSMGGAHKSIYEFRGWGGLRRYLEHSLTTLVEMTRTEFKGRLYLPTSSGLFDYAFRCPPAADCKRQVHQ